MASSNESDLGGRSQYLGQRRLRHKLSDRVPRSTQPDALAPRPAAANDQLGSSSRSVKGARNAILLLLLQMDVAMHKEEAGQLCCSQTHDLNLLFQVAVARLWTDWTSLSGQKCARAVALWMVATGATPELEQR